MGWIGTNKKFYSVLKEVTFVANPQIGNTLKLLDGDAVILDIGAGGRRITEKTITFDSCQSINTDILGDIHGLPVKDNSIDAVFCTGVLEHVASPENVLKEINRVLKDGAIVHIEVPFLQGYHLDPKDYWRWTLDGLIFIVNKYSFKELSSGVHIGPSSTVLWILDAYITILFGYKYLGRWLSRVFRILFFYIKYLDYFVIKRKGAEHIASGIYFVGKK